MIINISNIETSCAIEQVLNNSASLALALNQRRNTERADLRETRVVDEEARAADHLTVAHADGEGINVADDVGALSRQVFALLSPVADEPLDVVDVGKTPLADEEGRAVSVDENLAERLRKVGKLVGGDVAVSEEIHRLVVKILKGRASEILLRFLGEHHAERGNIACALLRDHVKEHLRNARNDGNGPILRLFAFSDHLLKQKGKGFRGD